MSARAMIMLGSFLGSLLGPYWCQKENTWLRFRETEEGFIAEQSTPKGTWEKSDKTVWAVDYEEGVVEPFKVFFQLQDGILYRTEGKIDTRSQRLTVSSYKGTDKFAMNLNRLKANEFIPFHFDESFDATYNNYCAPNILPYNQLPPTPERIAEQQQEINQKWQVYQEKQGLRQEYLENIHCEFSEEQKFVLNQRFSEELEYLSPNNFENWRDYIQALESILTLANDDACNAIETLASKTYLYEEIGLGISDKKRFSHKHKIVTFYYALLQYEFDFLCEEYRVLPRLLNAVNPNERTYREPEPRDLSFDPLQSDHMNQYPNYSSQNFFAEFEENEEETKVIAALSKLPDNSSKYSFAEFDLDESDKRTNATADLNKLPDNSSQNSFAVNLQAFINRDDLEVSDERTKVIAALNKLNDEINSKPKNKNNKKIADFFSRLVQEMNKSPTGKLSRETYLKRFRQLDNQLSTPVSLIIASVVCVVIMALLGATIGGCIGALATGGFGGFAAALIGGAIGLKAGILVGGAVGTVVGAFTVAFFSEVPHRRKIHTKDIERSLLLYVDEDVDVDSLNHLVMERFNSLLPPSEVKEEDDLLTIKSIV